MIKSLNTQVGGSHYLKHAIQSLPFAEKIGLSPMCFCAFKYVVRYKDKNGVEDLQKAKHCLHIFRECGVEKSIDLSEVEITEFLSQFDENQSKALFSIIQLQSNKRLMERCWSLINELEKRL